MDALQLTLTARALTVDDGGGVPTVLRLEDMRDVTLERRALAITVRGGRLVLVPFQGWQRAEVQAIHEELRATLGAKP